MNRACARLLCTLVSRLRLINSFSSRPPSSVLSLFLFSPLPGFAPLLLSAHFLKSSARTLQPAQPGGVRPDQRFVDTLAHLPHTQTHTSTPLNRVSAPSAPSRSLLSLDEVQDVPPRPLFSVSTGYEDLCSLMKKL